MDLSSNRRRLLLVGGLVLGAVFIYLSLRGTEPHAIAEALRRANLWLAPTLLISLALFFWLKAIRWCTLLSPLRPVAPREIVPVLMVGYASNVILPAQLGELVRMYLASREFDIGKAPVLATIVVERMFDFLALLCFLGVVLLVDPAAPAELRSVGYVVGGIGLLLLAAVVACLAWNQRIVAWLETLSHVLPGRLAARFSDYVARTSHGLAAIRSPKLLLHIIATSFAQWGFMGLCAYIAIAAVEITAPISAGFTVLAFIVAGLTLPTSPGFIGTVQICFVLGLAPYGVSRADAFAASVYYHALVYTSISLAGLLFMRRLGYRFYELKSAAGADTGHTRVPR